VLPLEVKDGVYRLAEECPHVLGRERAMLLRKEQDLLCNDTF
jgi:hypothetical protein